MNRFMKWALSCALFLLPALAIGQTAVSGSRVQDGTGTGTLLASGTWNFGGTAIAVATGSFSGSVTAGTQTVTVQNASSITILSVPGVVVGSSAFNWDSFVQAAGTSATSLGAPYWACQIGATDTQTNSTPANMTWTCSNIAGQATWLVNGPAPAPSNVANVAASEIPVTFSATPNFSNLANSSYIVLSGNVTSWTIAAGIPGQSIHISFCENATGGYSVSGTPSNVINFPGLSATTANACTVVDFTWNSSQQVWLAASVAITGAAGSAGSIQYRSSSGTLAGASGATGDAVVFNPSGPQDYGLPPVGLTSIIPLGYIPIIEDIGDSITYGTYLASPVGAYPYWLAQIMGSPAPNDLGIPGSTTQQNDATIFSNLPADSTRVIVTHQLGTNNALQHAGDTNWMSNFQYNLAAQYALLAMPSSLVKYSTSSGVTLSGSWSAAAQLGTNDPGVKCTGTSCGVTVTGTGTVFYLTVEFGGANTSATTGTLTCDGTTEAAPSFAGAGGTFSAQTALFAVRGLSAGSHSCTMQSTSSSGAVYFAWAAFLPGTSIGNRTVLAGCLPYTYPDTSFAPYRALQQPIVNQLRADGLTNLVYVDTTQAFPSAYTSFADGAIHPHEYGQFELAGVYLSAFNSLHGTTLTMPTSYHSRDGSSSYTTGGANVFIGGGINYGVGSTCTTCQGNVGFTSNWQAITTGTQNTAAGWFSGAGCTTCTNITLFGYHLGTQLATNANIDAFGVSALNNATTGATNDSAFGVASGLNCTTCTGNALFGPSAGQGITTATNLSAFGYRAGYGNLTYPITSDSNCSFFGTYTSKDNTNILTNCGSFGVSALVGASGAYEVGTGNNDVANTFAFDGFPFVDSAGNGKFKLAGLSVGASPIPSAATIAPTAGLTHISGTAAISTITPPTVSQGTFTGCIKLVPDGLWTMTTGGNIALGSTAVVGRVLEECYDGTSWYPSY